MSASINALDNSVYVCAHSKSNAPSNQKLKILMLRVKNFVSKYFFEPFESLFYTVTQTIRIISWYSKYKSKVSRPLLFRRNLFIDVNFKKNIYFSKLEKVDPLLADPLRAEQRIDQINKTLKIGTCLGQSLSLLKSPNRLDEKSYTYGQSNEVIFFQSIQNQYSTLKWAAHFKKELREGGRSFEEFLTPSGKIDEALMFDFIHNNSPRAPRFFVRKIIAAIDPVVLKITDTELDSRRNKVSSVCKEEFFAQEKGEVLDLCEFFDGTQMERVQQISNCFRKVKGNFIFVTGEKKGGTAHAFFVKNAPGEFKAYDPATGWMFVFQNSDEGIECLIEGTRSIFPGAEDLFFSISTIRKIESMSIQDRLSA